MKEDIYRARVESLLQEFQPLSREERLGLIISKGRDYKDKQPPSEGKDCEITQCQSRSWFDAAFNHGRLEITAGSDSLLTCGIFSLLHDLLSGLSAKEVLETGWENLLSEIGLAAHLVSSRSNILHHADGRLRDAACGELGRQGPVQGPSSSTDT